MQKQITNCAACKEARGTPVPFAAYEAQMTRYDDRLRRAHIIIAIISIVAILALLVSTKLWLNLWREYDFESSESVVVDASDGIANYAGGDVVNNVGTDYCDENTDAAP